jgi:hypothetical protein
MPVAVRPCRRGLSHLAAAVLLLASAATATAATPRDELLRYVPDDVGFCFLLQDFRDQMKTLAASPFSEQLDKSPLGKAFAGAQELKKLVGLEKQLKDLIGLGPDELCADILGDAVVFAFRPGAPGKPEQDEALLLVRARDEKKLRKLVEHVNAAQKESGQLKSLDERAYNGMTYFRRQEPKETNYYHLRGPVLVFSGQEAILKRALDNNRTAVADAEPPLARRLREAALPRSVFTAWINPRAFDAQLAAQTEAAVRTDAAFLKNFTRYWKALDGAFVALGTEKGFSLTVALQGRPDELPAAARKLCAEVARPSDLTAAFPDNALLAGAVRLDFAALVEMLGDFMTKENREAFGRQVSFGGVLGNNFLKDVGPDVGFAVFAPEPAEKSWLPHAAFALRLGPGPNPKQRTDQAIVVLLNSFAAVQVVAHNQQHPDETLDLAVIHQAKREVHTLSGDKVLPPGVQPSLTLAGGYLLLADSPETICRIADALGGERKAPPDDTVPLVQVSLKAWRHYLGDRRKALEQSMVERDKITEREAKERLDNLLGVLQFVDRLEISHCTARGWTTLTISLQPAYALKK